MMKCVSPDAISKIMANPSPDSSSDDFPLIVVQVLDLKLTGNSRFRYFSFNLFIFAIIFLIWNLMRNEIKIVTFDLDVVWIMGFFYFLKELMYFDVKWNKDCDFSVFHVFLVHGFFDSWRNWLELVFNLIEFL